MKSGTPQIKRDVLDNQKFMEGNRQRWCGVFMLYSLLILFTQIKWGVNPEPYTTFALTIGSLFILGGSVDSFLKIQAARAIKEKAIDTTSKD